MTTPPAKQRFSIFSMEALFAAFGLFSLISGVWRGELMPIFWGGIILVGLIVLTAVRRRDWKRHWEELEQQRGRNPDRDREGPP